jgi:hypothetical protein
MLESGLAEERMLPKAILRSRLLLVPLGAIAVVGAASVVQTDTLLSQGFDKALESSRPALTFAPSNGRTSQSVGDEGYWLTRSEVESPTPLKPLSIGDRITISGNDGRERKLEVVDLKGLGAEPAARAGAALTRLLLVTCKVIEADRDPHAATVRFIVEAEPAAPLAPAASKAL